MRLYHPELERTIDVPDDEGLFSVLKESGWSKTIPAEHNPAHAADQPADEVIYQPVPAEKPKTTTRKAAKTD